VLFSGRVKVRIRVTIRFSVWLVSGYAHVFILLSVVIVTLPKQTANTATAAWQCDNIIFYNIKLHKYVR